MLGSSRPNTTPSWSLSLSVTDRLERRDVVDDTPAELMKGTPPRPCDVVPPTELIDDDMVRDERRGLKDEFGSPPTVRPEVSPRPNAGRLTLPAPKEALQGLLLAARDALRSDNTPEPAREERFDDDPKGDVLLPPPTNALLAPIGLVLSPLDVVPIPTPLPTPAALLAAIWVMGENFGTKGFAPADSSREPST